MGQLCRKHENNKKSYLAITFFVLLLDTFEKTYEYN